MTMLGSKQRWEVVARKINTPKVLDLGDGKKLRLAKRGATEVRDAGLARALEQKFGPRGGNGDVLVIPVDNNHLHEPGEAGHRYTHTVPELPWQKGRKRYWEKNR